ncbi:hypothetical protein [Prevotella multiformis]|uniref:hypothetical protein n=1 Tax=Prevotella multiformis TaxID=282402 RepID=UPI0028DC81DC|nr:hypothetical protein [Prevotella multiformis]
MNDFSAIFASMEDEKYNYREQDIRLVTAFDELADMDTSQLDGYMILACDGGKMDVDVNGARIHLDTWEALILPPHTRLTNLYGESADTLQSCCSECRYGPESAGLPY